MTNRTNFDVFEAISVAVILMVIGMAFFILAKAHQGLAKEEARMAAAHFERVSGGWSR